MIRCAHGVSPDADGKTRCWECVRCTVVVRDQQLAVSRARVAELEKRLREADGEIMAMIEPARTLDGAIGRLTGAARDLGITYRRFALDSRIDDILARVDDPHEVLDEYIRELASENRRLTDTGPGEGE